MVTPRFCLATAAILALCLVLRAESTLLLENLSLLLLELLVNLSSSAGLVTMGDSL